ncbi:S-4TM family putative pore-forming effector [Streptacidiphilus sp. N1-3]|uniref:S-4TM family putative pore-forming effector n=1 Tax=Streptacidiphilus alkalitolerans TaxID=3342712 RepID=A0ABV6X814_9ACTN
MTTGQPRPKHLRRLLAYTPWLVIGRLVLTGLEQNSCLQAVRVQELYDTELFRLPWNQALAGRRPTPDDVASASRHIKEQIPYLDRYSIELGDTPWPGDVLLCQRRSAVWSPCDHRAHAVFIMTASATWPLAIITLATARDMTLAAFLISLFLPSTPAITDAVELTRTHWRQSAAPVAGG